MPDVFYHRAAGPGVRRSSAGPFLLSVLAGTLLSLFGMAQPAPADQVIAVATPASPERHRDPARLLRETTDDLLAAITAPTERTSEARFRTDLVRKHISTYMDFAVVARRVLGRHWRRATPTQRGRFVSELERLVYRAFADLLVRERAVRIDYKAARFNRSMDRALVRSTLYTETRKPLDVRFRLHQFGPSWQLDDVVIEGVSLVATYRAALDAAVRNKGLEALIESLAAKNRALDSAG